MATKRRRAQMCYACLVNLCELCNDPDCPCIHRRDKQLRRLVAQKEVRDQVSSAPGAPSEVPHGR